MISNWGIRARVMLAAVVPTLALAVVLTVFYTTSRLADLDEAHADRGRAFTRQLAAASEYAVFSGNLTALHKLTAAAIAEGDVVGAAILGRDGELLADSGHFDRSLLPVGNAPYTAGQSASGSVLRFIEPIQPSRLDLDDGLAAVAMEGSGRQVLNEPLGSVVLVLSRERLQSQRDKLLWAAAGSVGLVLLGSILLASHLSRGVSGPIREVAQTVARIGEGKLSERVPIMGGGSLRTLAEGVNEMAERLAGAHDELARQVAEATAELRARKEEAERANLAKSRFLAAASHDLRQPMHALGLFIAELAQHAHAPESLRLVHKIAASAEAMEDLLDSLLDISKLDAGVLHPNVRPFALAPVLERIAAEQRPAALERDLELRVRPRHYWVESDPVLFERILTNLVSNAIRYTPSGRVLIACRRRGERLRVEVRDSGIGIAAEAQDIIFQEFVQLNNPERSRDKGLGLGLAIVRRLIALLGHHLEVRSVPGGGSVFAVELPLARPDEGVGAPAADRLPGDLAGLRVALIEDDPLARAGMESLLASWGCVIVSVADPAALLETLAGQDEPPQLVISDFRLHGPLNGIEAIALVRQHYGAALPAVLISGDTGADTLRKAQTDGLPLLHKPVRPARLRALLHRLHATA